MQKSKGFALMFLLGAFLAGGALGFTANRLISPEKPCRGQAGDGWKRLNEELNLTSAQRTAVDSLMELRRHQMRELYKPLRPQLDSLSQVGRRIGDSTHAQVRRLLTPEQQAKWDAMRERARKKKSQWGDSVRERR